MTQVIEKRDAAAALQAFMDLYGAVGGTAPLPAVPEGSTLLWEDAGEYVRRRRRTSFKDGKNRSTALEQKQRPGDVLRVSIVPYRPPMVHFWDL